MVTPTPKKAGRKSTSSNPVDSDRVSLARYNVARDLRPKGRLPHLDNIVDTIGKQLKAIDELMKRCIHSVDLDGPALLPLSIFTKRTFDVARSRNVGGRIQFVTYPECAEMIFDIESLLKLPSELGHVPVETYKSGLIKYDLFFEASLLLDDTVLVPFLSNLKAHLVRVQACLGKIDEWLALPTTNVPFLESAFGTGIAKDAEKRYRENPLCRNCQHLSKRHVRRGNYSVCPHKGTRYQRSRAFLLKEVATTSINKYEFCLTDANDQSKLLRLIDYVSHK